MTLIENLKATKQELITRGWNRGDLIDSRGCVCLLGAVGVAVVGEGELRTSKYEVFIPGGSPEAIEVVNALARVIDDPRRGADHQQVYSFNDEAAEADEVIELIDKTIEAAA